MYRGAWQAIIHGVAKSQTWLSNWACTHLTHTFGLPIFRSRGEPSDTGILVLLEDVHRRKKTLESPLDCKEVKPVNPKGNQPWIVIGRTDAELQAPVLWPPDVKSRLTGKDPDAGKDWRQEEKGMTEDEMVGWHHWLNGHEFEQAQGDGEGQGSLACCSPWGREEWDTTETKQQQKVLDRVTASSAEVSIWPWECFWPCFLGRKKITKVIN